MTGELQALVTLISTGGLPLVIAFLIIGGQKRWYIWGPTMDAELKAKDELIKVKDAQISLMAKDRDDWKELAQRGTAESKLLIEWAIKTANENKK